jgi:tetratricopeptide (TPR) repeat protein
LSLEMASIQDLLQRLEKAKGDIRAQSALTTEFLIMARPETERVTLRAGLDAATVLHWFDAKLLEKVLEISQDEAWRQLDKLKEHSFVERYRGETDQHHNLHEATRLGWRIRFACERPERFRALSLRASSCFAHNPTPGDRIEWIYHLLCGDPELAASELEKLDREWSASARPEDRSALATALQELVETKLVDSRARARCLLAIAWSRTDRETTSRLAEIATEALSLAQRAEDESATADAWALKGRVSETQGQLDTAEAAFEQTLAISRRLAEQDPSNAGWQRDLMLAYGQVGGVLEAQGRLEAARAAFDQCLAISRRLAEQDPSNAGWQRDLAVAYSWVGGVLQAQGRLEAAQAAFEQRLAISRRLAEQDPSNTGWQRDLAVAYSRVGGVLEAQGRLEAAQAAFDQNLTISRRLAGRDPSNADWQRNLALACLRIGRIAVAANLKDIGLPLYEESLRVFAALVQRAPGFVQWAEDMKVVEAELMRLRSSIPSPNGAADGG